LVRSGIVKDKHFSPFFQAPTRKKTVVMTLTPGRNKNIQQENPEILKPSVSIINLLSLHYVGQNKLEYLLLAVFRLVSYSCNGLGAYPFSQGAIKGSIRVGSGLFLKYLTSLETLARD
jgi:hypothetical protein